MKVLLDSCISRILATIDKDLGELVIVQEMVHVCLIRLVGFRVTADEPLRRRVCRVRARCLHP